MTLLTLMNLPEVVMSHLQTNAVWIQTSRIMTAGYYDGARFSVWFVRVAGLIDESKE